jgi:hypothetical protein
MAIDGRSHGPAPSSRSIHRRAARTGQVAGSDPYTISTRRPAILLIGLRGAQPDEEAGWVADEVSDVQAGQLAAPEPAGEPHQLQGPVPYLDRPITQIAHHRPQVLDGQTLLLAGGTQHEQVDVDPAGQRRATRSMAVV